MNLKEQEIQLLLFEVLRGYSKLNYRDNVYYLRHFLIYQELELSEFEFEALNSAAKKGIKKEEDLLATAIKRKFWSEQDEKTIESLKWMISKSEAAVAKVVDINIKKGMEASIQKDRDKLLELQSRRSSIISHSAESLAARKKNTKNLLNNIFKNEALTESVEEDDLFYLMPLVNEKVEKLSSVENMLRMAYMPSFFDVYALSDSDPLRCLGKTMFDISIWQKNLIFYASVLLNKLKNMDMPDNITDDPVKIYNFKPKENQSNDDKTTHGVSDLRDKMAKSGGKLTAEDF